MPPIPVELRGTTVVNIDWPDNADLEFTIAWIEKDDDGNVVGPLDVSAWSFASHIKRFTSVEEPLAAAEVARPADHQTTFTFARADLAAAREECDEAVWDLTFTDADAHRATPYGGVIRLRQGVTTT